jgi:hypothetical protein
MWSEVISEGERFVTLFRRSDDVAVSSSPESNKEYGPED